MPQRKKKQGRFVRYANTAQKALQIALMTKKLLNVEFKHKDTASASTVGTTATISPLCLIAEGDTESTRSGISVRSKSLLLKAYFTKHASAVETSMRLMVVRDSLSDGTVPAITEILESESVLAQKNYINSGRFHIMMDRRFHLNSVKDNMFDIDKYWKLDHHVKYKSNGATQSDIYSGAYYIVLLSTSNTNQPSYSYDVRWRYIDN